MERFITKFKEKYQLVIRHKYFYTALVMVVYILFFSQHDIFERIKELSNGRKLKSERNYYLEKIKEDSLKLNDLKTNNKNLIKFAREQYHMKADNEDIFIIREK